MHPGYWIRLYQCSKVFSLCVCGAWTGLDLGGSQIYRWCCWSVWVSVGCRCEMVRAMQRPCLHSARHALEKYSIISCELREQVIGGG